MKVADAFALLGLPETATPQDVNAAWKATAKRLHPDLAPGCEDEFHRAYAAYQLASKAAAVCRVCGGSGKVRLTKGFQVVEVACNQCQGGRRV